jgi:hypothetical protein
MISTGTYTRHERRIDAAPFAAMDKIIKRLKRLQKRIEKSVKKTEIALNREGKRL